MAGVVLTCTNCSHSLWDEETVNACYCPNCGVPLDQFSPKESSPKVFNKDIFSTVNERLDSLDRRVSEIEKYLKALSRGQGGSYNGAIYKR